MKLAILVFILASGCSQKDTFQEWQDDAIQELLAEDRANKELELIYLDEIGLAQENNDTEALDFYLNEYLSVPRLDVPDHLKIDSRYFIGGDQVKY